MICQACGVEAQTKHVAFYQNIGALVVRFSRSIEGDLCKSCIHRFFWRFTGTNLLLGWWGVISFVMTPFLILNNVGRYLFCLGMTPVAPDAAPPQLTENAVDRIKPYAQEMFGRLGEKEPLERVAEDIALRAGVTPGQVFLFLQAVARAAKSS